MKPAFAPIFAFDNYFSKTELAGRTTEQAELLRSLGYDAAYHAIGRTTAEGWNRFLAWESLTRSAGLAVAGYYTDLTVGESTAELHGVEEVIRHLPAGSVLDLAVRVTNGTASDSHHDEVVMTALLPFADLAASRNVTLSLYPHIWFWIERSSDAVRVAEKMNHPAVRVTFCGYHWQVVEGDALSEKLRAAAPWLAWVNVCGTRTYAPDQPSPTGLPASMEPVGVGEFPLDEFIRGLHAIHYTRAVGFQGYQIGGNPAETLAQSLSAWNQAVRQSAE